MKKEPKKGPQGQIWLFYMFFHDFSGYRHARARVGVMSRVGEISQVVVMSQLCNVQVGVMFEWVLCPSGCYIQVGVMSELREGVISQ